ncbi:hypothetical protein [Streptomyces sp. NPDC058084]|uniref:hypothetical protein n=1 Tax=Streptomyces sp. NPDC058084 TaxID=3346333 RepID=UPI0036E7ACD9
MPRSRRRPRSPGVSLGNRAIGLHHYRDEISSFDGGKKHLHRRVRGHGKAALRRLVLEATGVQK